MVKDHPPNSKKSINDRIAYIDLYAGPGRYDDGTASTPLLVAQKIIDNPSIHDHATMLLNDMDKDNYDTLQHEIRQLPGIEKLKFTPEVLNNEVADDAANYFANTRMKPSFTFFDPFGYKGLSLKLIQAFIKDWGCDCIFFFNYSRINAGINNPSVSEHMAALFGERRLQEMQDAMTSATTKFREEFIIEKMCQALKAEGAKFVLPFRFKDHTERLTHHLIFVSKNFKGFEVMKGIMTQESSTHPEGVGSFTYSKADETMPLLFEFQKPLSTLITELPERMPSTPMTRDEIYRLDSVDRPYLKTHYTQALEELENQGRIRVTSTKSNRRTGQFPTHTKVEFLK